jgi:competence ComEA-like helix-hairpin-helix protein
MRVPVLYPSRTRAISFTLLLLALGLSLTSCVKRATTVPHQHTVTSSNSAELSQSRTERININTASAKELEQLPGIGKGLAERIVDQREKYGPFRRPEHLIIVRGISDKRFRGLRDLITVE